MSTQGAVRVKIPIFPQRVMKLRHSVPPEDPEAIILVIYLNDEVRQCRFLKSPCLPQVPLVLS